MSLRYCLNCKQNVNAEKGLGLGWFVFGFVWFFVSLFIAFYAAAIVSSSGLAKEPTTPFIVGLIVFFGSIAFMAIVEWKVRKKRCPICKARNFESPKEPEEKEES